jgi:N-acetylmuramic acid 6-phosphate (MurNAc-6-P) etherase
MAPFSAASTPNRHGQELNSASRIEGTAAANCTIICSGGKSLLLEAAEAPPTSCGQARQPPRSLVHIPANRSALASVDGGHELQENLVQFDLSDFQLAATIAASATTPLCANCDMLLHLQTKWWA